MPDFDEMRNALDRATGDYQRRRRSCISPLRTERNPIGCAPGNLSIGPLLDKFADLGELDDKQLGIRLGVGRSTVLRWRREGLPLRIADRVAIHLGMHPVEIWGNAYWSAR